MPPSADTGSPHSDPAPTPGADADVRPILIVEDSEEDIELLRRLFAAAKVTTPLEIALSGNDAMRRFQTMPATAAPRLIVTDLSMPDGDGFEVLAWAREQPALKDALRIVLSSTRRGSDIDRCYALGASFFLSKFPSPAILAALCTAADKKDAEALSRFAALHRATPQG